MTEAVSCGGVVIHDGKDQLLYKNQYGWVLPKGTVEPGETYQQTALREVKEETNSDAEIVKYIGKTQYTFRGNEDIVSKTVHWYLMVTDSFDCKPQAEEFFVDADFYKQHEASYLLKFHDEKQMMRRAFMEYNQLQTRKQYI